MAVKRKDNPNYELVQGKRHKYWKPKTINQNNATKSELQTNKISLRTDSSFAEVMETMRETTNIDEIDFVIEQYDRNDRSLGEYCVKALHKTGFVTNERLTHICEKYSAFGEVLNAEHVDDEVLGNIARNPDAKWGDHFKNIVLRENVSDETLLDMIDTGTQTHKTYDAFDMMGRKQSLSNDVAYALTEKGYVRGLIYNETIFSSEVETKILDFYPKPSKSADVYKWKDFRKIRKAIRERVERLPDSMMEEREVHEFVSDKNIADVFHAKVPVGTSEKSAERYFQEIIPPIYG